METQTAVQTHTAGAPRLKNKVAIITGSAQGIGLATAELFCQEGAKVVLVDVDEGLVSQSAQRLASNGGETIGAKADVTRYADCEGVAKAALEKWGKIDILINNAGITRDSLLMRMSEADWDLVMNVNLKGAFNFIKAVIRPMLKTHYGRIVNISSIVGEEGNAGQANYSSSKAGVIGLTKSAAREFASRNILCNAIAPGFIRTRLTEAIPEPEKQKLLTKILVGRIGEPIDIAKAALFLASDDASYITGVVLKVNGGGYM